MASRHATNCKKQQEDCTEDFLPNEGWEMNQMKYGKQKFEY